MGMRRVGRLSRLTATRCTMPKVLLVSGTTRTITSTIGSDLSRLSNRDMIIFYNNNGGNNSNFNTTH